MSEIDQGGIESPKPLLYAHMPGVALDGIPELPLSSGRLTPIAFKTWRELDDWVTGENPAKFEANRPIFYVSEIDVPEGPFATSEIEAAVEPLLNRVVSALLLGTGWVFPDPRLSVLYVQDSSSGAVSTLVGPAGRNLLLGSVPRSMVVNTENAEEVRRMFDLAGRTAHVLADPHVDQAVAALRRAVLPEYRAIDNIVHTTLALEGLVSSARPGSGSTATVIERSAALTARTRKEVDQYTKILEDIYDSRSLALHGTPESHIEATADAARVFVILAVTHTLAFIGEEPVRSGLGALRRLLARALRDEEAWNQLRVRCGHVPPDTGDGC
jgi:hypothetical protein